MCRVMAALGLDLERHSGSSLRFQRALAAENLFCWKRLALSQKRQVRPRRASDSNRLALVLLTRCFTWREALTLIETATPVRWHSEPFACSGHWRLPPQEIFILPGDYFLDNIMHHIYSIMHRSHA